MNINFKIQGLNNIKKKLAKNANALLDLTRFWQTVGMYIQKQTIKQRFDKQQSPNGEAWKPLSEFTRTMRLRRNKTGDMKILQDTGELRRSINYQAGKNHVKVGSNLKYARIHQFGGSINVSKKQRGFLYRKGFTVGKKIIIPARPFLGVTQSEKNHIKSMFRQFLKRNVFSGG